MAEVIVEREHEPKTELYPTEEKDHLALEFNHRRDNDPVFSDDEPQEPRLLEEDRAAPQHRYAEPYDEQLVQEPAQSLENSPLPHQDPHREDADGHIEDAQHLYERERDNDSIDDDAINVEPDDQYQLRNEDPYEEDPYEDDADELYEHLRPRRTRRAIYDDDANSQSPTPSLPTLSPTMIRARPGRVCLRPICRATQSEGAQWGCSPDGRWTLCLSCYNLYSACLLPLFQRRDGTLSILNTPGSCPMRITGFALRPVEVNGRVRRDLSKPRVTPITDSPEDQALLSNQYGLKVRQTRKRKRVDRENIPSQKVAPKPPRKQNSIRGNYSLPGPMGYTLDEQQKRVPRSLSVGLKEGEGVYIRAEWEDDVREFRIRSEITLEQFKREIRAVFGFKQGFLFSLTYLDFEDNYVRIGSDERLQGLFGLVDADAIDPIQMRLVA